MTGEPSRLDAIRENINGCGCEKCEALVHRMGARELLAVVDAESGGLTPKQIAGVYAYSLGLETDPGTKDELRRKLAAWERLT